MASPKPKRPTIKVPVRPVTKAKTVKTPLSKPTPKKPSLNDFLKAGKKPPVKLKPGLKPGPDGMDVKLPKKTK